MINDSRTRRKQKGKQINCENCEFKTGSISILKLHSKNCQNEKYSNNKKETSNSKRIHCCKCDKKFNKDKTYMIHMKNVHNETNIDDSLARNSRNSINKIESYTKLTFPRKSRNLRSNKSLSSALEPNS